MKCGVPVRERGCPDEIWTVKTWTVKAWTTVMAGRQVDWIILQKG